MVNGTDTLDGGDVQPAIVTRAEAKARGLKQYFTGKPCKRGHVAERKTDNRNCVECYLAATAAWRAANPEKLRAWNAAWCAANPEKLRARNAAWEKANRDKRNAKTSRRRARKLNALCKCCTRAEVAAVYKNAPPGHEVDHIHALALGGLHCVKNLQVLPEAVHIEKTKPDMRAIADARWLLREQRAGRVPGDPAKTAAAFRMAP